jgi:hypothetical protein
MAPGALSERFGQVQWLVPEKELDQVPAPSATKFSWYWTICANRGADEILRHVSPDAAGLDLWNGGDSVTSACCLTCTIYGTCMTEGTGTIVNDGRPSAAESPADLFPLWKWD